MTQLEKDLRTAAKVVTQTSARYFVKRATYARINKHRGELIDRKVGLTRPPLTEAEAVELEQLQEEVGRLVDLAYPRPVAEWDRLYQELVRKYGAPLE